MKKIVIGLVYEVCLFSDDKGVQYPGLSLAYQLDGGPTRVLPASLLERVPLTVLQKGILKAESLELVRDPRDPNAQFTPVHTMEVPDAPDLPDNVVRLFEV